MMYVTFLYSPETVDMVLSVKEIETFPLRPAFIFNKIAPPCVNSM